MDIDNFNITKDKNQYPLQACYPLVGAGLARIVVLGPGWYYTDILNYRLATTFPKDPRYNEYRKY
jgi:hypothetical protein